MAFFSHRRGPRGRFVFLPLLAAAAALALGGAVMGLWNAVLPAVAHAGRLSYWQGVALFVLCRVLFGSVGAGWGGRSPAWGGGWRAHQEKWQRMSPEERQEFRQKWQERGRRGWSGPRPGTERGPQP